MLTTPHLGDRPHPVVASAARELLNKSENERSGVPSTAMSFLGLYRDPVVAQVTRRCDWRIADLVPREGLVVALMVMALLWLGLYPRPVLDTFQPAMARLRVFHHPIERSLQLVRGCRLDQI